MDGGSGTVAYYYNQRPENLHGKIPQRYTDHERRQPAICLNAAEFEDRTFHQPRDEKRKPQSKTGVGGHDGIGQRIQRKPIEAAAHENHPKRGNNAHCESSISRGISYPAGSLDVVGGKLIIFFALELGF